DLVLLYLNVYLDSLRTRDSELHRRLIQELEAPHGFTTFFRFFSGSLTDVKVAPQEALSVFWRSLKQVAPPDMERGLRAMFVSSLEQFSLTPSVEILEDGQESPGPFDDSAAGQSVFVSPGA
ncbi:MAG TPA: hypothetical protein PLS53_16770, partial [Thermoanaerobaculaceae bacterium]|nr:hypothetical protein [Thermoanaerobaculaceae bacterium]